jgi:aminopeptidase N
MEQASGQDLAWFFHQWLNRSGVPAIEGNWRYDAAAKNIVVTVKQTQTGEPYQFPLGIGVTPATGAARVVEMKVTGRDSTFTIPAEAAPAKVVLDPDVWLLAQWGTFGTDPGGFAPPDPSARSLAALPRNPR